MAAAVVVLIIIAAAVYRFVLVPSTGSESSPAVAALEDSSQTEFNPGTSDSLASAPSSEPDDVMAGEVGSTEAGDSVTGPESERPEPPVPGNTASDYTPTSAEGIITVVRGMGGYTLIVGSTLNPVTAELERERFAPLGMPTGLLAYQGPDTTRYRIAVGHFNTAAEADSARVSESERLPEGTWVLSVR